MLNRIGSRIEPWGAPLVTSHQPDSLRCFEPSHSAGSSPKVVWTSLSHSWTVCPDIDTGKYDKFVLSHRNPILVPQFTQPQAEEAGRPWTFHQWYSLALRSELITRATSTQNKASVYSWDSYCKELGRLRAGWLVGNFWDIWPLVSIVASLLATFQRYLSSWFKSRHNLSLSSN